MKFAPLLILAGLLLIQAAPAAALGPTGEYRIVAVRAASDTPSGPPSEAFRGQVLGRDMMFTPKIWWFDDRACVSARLRPSTQAWEASADPNLSDLQVVVGPKDRRANAVWMIDCGGRAITEITPFLVVDERVVVTRSRNGAAYLVFERQPSRAEARSVERGLARAGFDPGPVDGVIDGPARRAVALFARKHGAAYAFDGGVLTQNVFEALTAASEPAPR